MSDAYWRTVGSKLRACSGIAWLDLQDGNLYGLGSRSREQLLCEQIVSPTACESDVHGETAVMLEDLLGKWRLEKAPFWLVVPAEQTIIRAVYFPSKKRRHLRRALAWEWQEYFPLPQDDFVYDYSILPEKNGAGWVMWIFASPHSYLLPWFQVCEDAGITLAGVDLSVLCAHRASGAEACIAIAGGRSTCTVTGFAPGEVSCHSSIPASVPDVLALPELIWQERFANLPVYLGGQQVAEMLDVLLQSGIPRERVILSEGSPSGFLARRHFPVATALPQAGA